MRFFLSLLCCFLLSAGMNAASGPGKPVPVEADLTAFLEAYGLVPTESRTAAPTLPTAAPTAEERTALANAFAAPPVLSPTGDDLRKVAAFTDQVKGKVDSARAILNMVRDEARQLSNLVDAQLAALPLGIKQTVGNTEIFIAIAEARLTPSAAEVDIYLSLDLPDTDQDPIFLAKGVGWSRLLPTPSIPASGCRRISPSILMHRTDLIFWHKCRCQCRLCSRVRSRWKSRLVSWR